MTARWLSWRGGCLGAARCFSNFSMPAQIEPGSGGPSRRLSSCLKARRKPLEKRLEVKGMDWRAFVICILNESGEGSTIKIFQGGIFQSDVCISIKKNDFNL